DRLQTRTDSLQGASSLETYEYDASGNLLKFTDRRGKVSTCQYDALNRRVFVGFGTVGSGETATYESTTSFSYDAANRLVSAVDSQTGTITRSYNDQARMVSETSPQGTVTYSFDALGRRTLMTIAGQPSISYNYDDANRLIGITQGTSSVTFVYDDANRLTHLTLPNGILMEYGYDSGSQMTSLTYKQGQSVLGNLAYSYDQVGRRTKLGGSLARTGLPQALASANYNADNQLTQFSGQTLTYDANGNLTNNGLNTYSWDARNQLASITGGITASFQYDAFGRRINKTINGNSTSFLYDGANVIQELSGTTSTATMLTGRIDQIFSRNETSGNKSFLTDGLGSIIAETDSNGAPTTEYTYEPFGNTTQASSGGQPHQFNSRENDSTGLYYYRARYYSPTLQRFISEDPVGLGGGDTNFYTYTANDPINYIDPLGHQMVGVTGGISGAGGAGALSAGGTGSVMSGVVYGDQGIRTGGAVSGGAYAFSGSDPANPGSGFGQGSALGAHAGAGVGLFFSNATSFDQLLGEFWTVQVNILVVSIEYDVSGNTKVFSVTAGKGVGGSIQILKTNTPYTWEGPFHPILPGAEPLLPPLLPPLTPGNPHNPPGSGYPFSPWGGGRK
ncbi:MAG: RHS repeat domain-containing protein, partial [Pyrinomonadaceae bacterium]